jgi:hypothetical protein
MQRSEAKVAASYRRIRELNSALEFAMMTKWVVEPSLLVAAPEALRACPGPGINNTKQRC